MNPPQYPPPPPCPPAWPYCERVPRRLGAARAADEPATVRALLAVRVPALTTQVAAAFVAVPTATTTRDHHTVVDLVAVEPYIGCVAAERAATVPARWVPASGGHDERLARHDVDGPGDHGTAARRAPGTQW